MTAKDKDRVLREIKAFKKPNEIANLPECLYDLENDGLVKVAYASDKSIITIRLSPRGQQFLDSGGYSRTKRTQVKSNVTKALWRIAEAVLIAIASGYCGWLLRGCTLEDSTAPGRPEPSEHHSIKTSSIRLSLKSLFDLNVVNIANRAKSFTHISDNSASVLRKSSIRIPDIDMSAVHLSNPSDVNSDFSGILYVTDIFIIQRY